MFNIFKKRSARQKYDVELKRRLATKVALYESRTDVSITDNLFNSNGTVTELKVDDTKIKPARLSVPKDVWHEADPKDSTRWFKE